MKNVLVLFMTFAPLWLFSQTFQLVVENGYGSGAYSTGDTIHIWAKEWAPAGTFSHWSGDTTFLSMPEEWHTTVIMPAQNISVTAHTSVLPTGTIDYFSYEQVMGKNILKPVYYYFPENGMPEAVVWLWHGTGGSAQNWIWKDFEMRQFCSYLVANNLAIIVTESDESTLHMDLDGDGNLRYNYSSDTINNWDIANVRAIRDTFINRGLMTLATPQAAVGFSAGGAFSVTVATFLGWQAAVSHNSSGAAYAPVSPTPILFSMSQKDAHPDVGIMGNLEAYENYQLRLDDGKCSSFFLIQPSPLYPQRFKRIPGVTTIQSIGISNELIINGCVGTDDYLTKSPNEIENLILVNPGNWPVVLSFSDTLRQYIKDELAVMWTSHHFHHDFMAADVKFIKQQCSQVVAVESTERADFLRVFPNPANETIHLPVQSGMVRIVNAQGNAVLRKQLSGSNELDVSALPAGVYFLEWHEKDQRKVVRWVKI